MKPVRIQFDTDFADDGLYSITFWFQNSEVPSYVSLAKDEIEDPECSYIEAEDQKYGFKATDLSYTIIDDTLGLSFSADSDNRFFWNKSKYIEIEIPVHELKNVELCLAHICK
jgi:hypothetical protein